MADDKGKTAAFKRVMEASDVGKMLEDKMRLNQQVYDKTLQDEKVERANIKQSFVNKLNVHCRTRKEQIKRLPGFWFKAIMAYPNLRSQLNARDSEIFENHLASFEVVYDEDSNLGFTVLFDFTENEYFSDKRIFKHFTFSDDGDLISTKSSCINWKQAIPDIVPEEDDSSLEAKLISHSFFRWFKSTSDKKKLRNGDHLGHELEKLWIDPLKHLHGDDDDTEDEVEG